MKTNRKLIVLMIMISLLFCCTKHENDGITRITYFSRSTPEQLKVWEKVISQFHQEYPGIRVKIENVQYNSYWPKLQTMIAAGTPPDVTFLESTRFASFVKKNSLVSLKQFIEKDDINLDDYLAISLKPYRFKGELYGLPNDIAIYVLFYNKELFNQAGVAYPGGKEWTWQKYLKTAELLTKYEPGGDTIYQYGSMNGPWRLWLWQNKGDVFINPLDPQKCIIGEQNSIQAIQFMADLTLKHKVSPNSLVLESSGGSFEMFLSGRIAMLIDGHWMVPRFRQANFKWDVAPLPRGRQRANWNAGSCFSIMKGSKHPEAAYKLIKFMAGYKGQRILVQDGFSTPVLKSIIRSDLFLKSGINEQVFIDEIPFAHLPPITDKYDEIMDRINSELEKVWIGEARASDLLPDLQKQLTQILDKEVK